MCNIYIISNIELIKSHYGKIKSQDPIKHMFDEELNIDHVVAVSKTLLHSLPQVPDVQLQVEHSAVGQR